MLYVFRMRAYPLFMNLAGCRALVVGAGAVGVRKVNGLVPCGLEEILVLDLQAARKNALPSSPCVRFACRSFEERDLEDRALVFAASGDRGVNARVARLCRERRIPCNVADAPDEGSFHVPALFVSGDFIAAFSSGGFSPALSRTIARETDGRYGKLLLFMARLRPLVLALGWNSDDNAALFRRMVDSALGDIFRAADDPQQRDKAERMARELLPPPLHEHIGALLHDLV